MSGGDDIAARLAAAKEERAKLAEARDKRAAESDLLEQLEREESALKSERALDAAVAEHGEVGRKIAVVETVAGTVIVKRPNHVLFKRFQDGGEASADAFEKLVRPTVVYPDRGAFDRMIEEYPGIVTPLANAVCKLAGVVVKEAGGK